MPPLPHLPRGARPAPRHKLLGTPTFRPVSVPPSQCAWVPAHLDMWGNGMYGDCVSAEEAFAKACHDPEIFIDASVVIAWARQRGYLNGADLTSVLDSMQKDGFVLGSQKYDDGPYLGVDYSQDSVLQAALASGPVKIAIDANALPQSAGVHQGWCAFGGGNHPNTDHCVALCGYGPCGWLYQQLGVQLPAGIDPGKPAYLIYTWSTIGVVDHAWLMGTCTEAYVRQPTTIGIPPLPLPTPPSPPPPPPSPTPAPTPAPLPVNVREIVDKMFADLEAHARRPAVRAALMLAQGLCDAWLASHGY